MMDTDKQAVLDFMHDMRNKFGEFEFQVTVINPMDGSDLVLRSRNYREPIPKQSRPSPRLVRDALRVATESVSSKGNQP
jgi:hypothetical protein